MLVCGGVGVSWCTASSGNQNRTISLRCMCVMSITCGVCVPVCLPHTSVCATAVRRASRCTSTTTMMHSIRWRMEPDSMLFKWHRRLHSFHSVVLWIVLILLGVRVQATGNSVYVWYIPCWKIFSSSGCHRDSEISIWYWCWWFVCRYGALCSACWNAK